MSETVKIRLGTRGSPLALVQATIVAEQLRLAHPHLAEPGALEIVIVHTTGDSTQKQNISLADRGGKGLFIKEIEDALIDGHIDVAVHSAKDMPTELPPGMVIGCVLPRADPRDAFFSRDGSDLLTLPAGSLVGTSAPRRQALVLAARPDLRVTIFRGNVDTRLRKLEEGVVDATLLAVSGLVRLGQESRIQTYLDPTIIVPAAGQGTIALEIRGGDSTIEALLAPIHCAESGTMLAAERLVVAALDGSCTSPIAAWARLENDQFVIDALAAKLDGTAIHRARLTGKPEEALALGQRAGEQLKNELPPYFFAA
jgi:hydroxymethylbilane synthase